MQAGSATRGVSIVRDFLRRRRTEILALWRRGARELPATSDLAPVRLIDHVPELLDQLADIADEIAADPGASVGFETARRHALDRIADGLLIGEVIQELSLLRACILDCWASERMSDTDALRSMQLAIDRAIAVTVARYAEGNADERFKQVAAERERVLAKLESLLAASPIGIAFVDRDLRFIRINHALASLNGRSPAEYIGRTVAEVWPETALRHEPLLRQILETGQPVVNRELSLPGATDADTRWFVANYFPVRGASGLVTGVGGMVLEVTEARRARDALEREQARLRSIVQNAPAAIWIKDIEGRIVIANQRLAEALGLPFEQVIGRRTVDVMPAEIAAQHDEHDRVVARTGQPIEVEETVPSPTGTRTFLSIKFLIPGSQPLIGGIATEITERKRMEEELRAAVRMREDLLAVVSHDLRNPLGAAQISASFLLAEHGAEQRMRRHIDVIHRSCTRMENLIDDLLDTANIRAGRFHLDVKREIIEDVVAEAVELQEPFAAEKGVTLVRSGDVRDIAVMCDRDRVLQVFGNLIGNALKFCRAGDTITIACTYDAAHVRFSVADTGPGIAPGVLPRLFEAYFSSPDHKQGSGLGLYIVRGIVESHGGTVVVESTLGEGATFTFTLPSDA